MKRKNQEAQQNTGLPLNSFIPLCKTAAHTQSLTDYACNSSSEISTFHQRNGLTSAFCKEKCPSSWRD